MNALSFIIEIIEKLMSDPGKFENYQKELTTLYIDHADNQHVVSNAIELFFNHVSIAQPFVRCKGTKTRAQSGYGIPNRHCFVRIYAAVDRGAKFPLHRRSTLPLIGQH